MRLSGLMKGYLAWTLAVCVWLASALGFGWRMPSLAGTGSAFGTSRSTGGYGTHSSWSFGK